MQHASHLGRIGTDRSFLIDHVLPEACFQHDEDTGEILSVVCDGDPRFRRGLDVMAETCRQGGYR